MRFPNHGCIQAEVRFIRFGHGSVVVPRLQAVSDEEVLQFVLQFVHDRRHGLRGLGVVFIYHALKKIQFVLVLPDALLDIQNGSSASPTDRFQHFRQLGISLSGFHKALVLGEPTLQPNPPGTLASVRRGGMAEKTAKCEAYVKRGSLI